MINKIKIRKILFVIYIVLMVFVTGCSEENKTIDAKSNDPVYYRVTLNLNDNEDDPTILNQTILEGYLATMPSLPQIPYHEFIGFFEGETLWDFENNTINRDVYLVAKWKNNIQDYQLVIDAIDEIDVSDYDNIKTVRQKYDNLNANDKLLVTNYEKLVQAEIDYTMSIYENSNTLVEYEKLIDLFESLNSDVLKELDINLQKIYNKLFELTYSDKVANVNSDQQNVIKAVANAFLYKGVYNQYDQTRRVNEASPYEASCYDTLYMDCSAYAYNVYTYVFGSQHNLKMSTGLTETYASGHQSNPDVLYYIKTSDYKTEASQKALLKEIYNNLQVGDCINYRHGQSSGSSGHVVMYIGNDTIIHSTGSYMKTSSYSNNPELFVEVQSSREKVDGSVYTFSAKEMFEDTTSSRYLFKKTSSDTVWTFAIIRPIAKSSSMKVSKEALSNYLLSDVDIFETSSVGARRSVLQNQEVTFTLNFVNHSDKEIKNIPIYKQIGEGYYEFVSTNENGIYIKNQGVYHSIDLKGNETKQINYTVRVKKDAVGIIYEGQTTIHNIDLPMMSNTVCKNMNEEFFIDNCKDLIMNETFSSSTDFIIACYRDSGYDLKQSFDFSNKTLAFIEGTKYRVADLYNGTKVKRLLQSSLEVGDILVTYNQITGAYTNYLYVSEELLVKIENGNYVMTKSADEVQEVLDKFFAYSKWAVIRPTMITN